jgi:excinuclease UvrABC nuclease subunit
VTEMLTRKERLADLRTAVYRFYDTNGQLLYLGITHDLGERWATHERIQPWWLDVSRREYVWYNTRAEAEQIEATATAAEKPLYDRSGQRTVGGPGAFRMGPEGRRGQQRRFDRGHRNRHRTHPRRLP